MLILHGIYTNNREEGIKYINKLIEGETVEFFKSTSNSYEVKTNVASYSIFPLGSNSRANRVHYAHVDNEVYKDEYTIAILEYFIKPSTSLSYIKFGDNPDFNENDYILYWGY